MLKIETLWKEMPKIHPVLNRQFICTLFKRYLTRHHTPLSTRGSIPNKNVCKATAVTHYSQNCCCSSDATVVKDQRFVKDALDTEKDLALFPNPSEKNMFVPKWSPPTVKDVEELQKFVRLSKKLLVLTGAGLSTESGIPDYRSEGVGLYARSTNRPVQYTDFVKYADIRKRYWARNYVGWPKFGYFLPNISHMTLASWENLGKVHWLVTQNVDALHYKAGSKKVTELHGSAHRVMCLDCPSKMTRPQMQDLIISTNPTWSAHSDEMAPDADVHLTSEQIEGFKVPPCPKCGGRLKPEITFFGDNVPKPVVQFVHERVKESNAVLLAGTSLQVYSGYRFVNAAKDQKKPIAIVNIGPTRADKLADLIINTKCGDILPQIRLTR